MMLKKLLFAASAAAFLFAVAPTPASACPGSDDAVITDKGKDDKNDKTAAKKKATDNKKAKDAKDSKDKKAPAGTTVSKK